MISHMCIYNILKHSYKNILFAGHRYTWLAAISPKQSWSLQWHRYIKELFSQSIETSNRLLRYMIFSLFLLVFKVKYYCVALPHVLNIKRRFIAMNENKLKNWVSKMYLIRKLEYCWCRRYRAYWWNSSVNDQSLSSRDKYSVLKGSRCTVSVSTWSFYTLYKCNTEVNRLVGNLP